MKKKILFMLFICWQIVMKAQPADTLVNEFMMTSYSDTADTLVVARSSVIHSKDIFVYDNFLSHRDTFIMEGKNIFLMRGTSKINFYTPENFQEKKPVYNLHMKPMPMHSQQFYYTQLYEFIPSGTGIMKGTDFPYIEFEVNQYIRNGDYSATNPELVTPAGYRLESHYKIWFNPLLGIMMIDPYLENYHLIIRKPDHPGHTLSWSP
jgi:hypothetical protein